MESLTQSVPSATDACSSPAEPQQLMHCPQLELVELLGGVCDIIPVDVLATFLVSRSATRTEGPSDLEHRNSEILGLREAKLEVRRSAEYLEHPNVVRCTEGGLRLTLVDK
jgi:hypothetical protein